MIKISIFQFSDFQINTYILAAENKDCIIIDPGCFYEEERQQFSEYIAKNGLNPVMLFNTHGHVDHVFGNRFVKNKYNIKIAGHKEDIPLIENAAQHAMMFGLEMETPPAIDRFVDEKDTIPLDGEELSILHVPGHSPGSVAFYNKRDNFIVVGDVLFQSSIGRTDLPGGDYDTLIKSITDKLLPLHDDVVVYPGHGPSTTIGDERKSNPFLI